MVYKVEVAQDADIAELVAVLWDSFERPYQGVLRTFFPILNNDREASLLAGSYSPLTDQTFRLYLALTMRWQSTSSQLIFVDSWTHVRKYTGIREFGRKFTRMLFLDCISFPRKRKMAMMS